MSNPEHGRDDGNKRPNTVYTDLEQLPTIENAEQTTKLTGITPDDIDKLSKIISRHGGLPEISTIEWGFRMVKEGLNKPFRRQKDIPQSQRLEAFRKGTADFETAKQWYLELGAESDLFKQVGTPAGPDIQQSEAVRVYLIRAAEEVIVHTNDNEGTEFELLPGNKERGPIMADKRILAANMLAEAAVHGFENRADPSEVIALFGSAKKLLEAVCVKNGQLDLSSKNSLDAALYLQDIFNQEAFFYNAIDSEGLAGVVKSLKQKSDALNIYPRVLHESMTRDDTGAASEALVGILMNALINRQAGDIAVYRKGYLREDVPYDFYPRYRLPKVASDASIFTYAYNENDELVPQDVYPIQVKASTFNVEPGTYSPKVGILDVSEVNDIYNGRHIPMKSADSLYSQTLRAIAISKREKSSSDPLLPLERALLASSFFKTRSGQKLSATLGY